jgi:hypothetical protein
MGMLTLKDAKLLSKQQEFEVFFMLGAPDDGD